MGKNLLILWIGILVGCLVYSSAFAGKIFELDFSKASGNVEDWFENRGWEFKQDMDDMNTRFQGGKLIIEPKDDIVGSIVIQFKGDNAQWRDKFKNVKRVRIEWGVDQYPKGANWTGPKSKKRNTREPISLMMFFGTKKYSSGSGFVPDLPRFISVFLGQKEKDGTVYYGNYWQAGGRYLCVGCNGKTGDFVTEVNLQAKYKELFQTSSPGITGLTIEVDAQDTDEVKGRYSKAYFKTIQFFD